MHGCSTFMQATSLAVAAIGMVAQLVDAAHSMPAAALSRAAALSLMQVLPVFGELRFLQAGEQLERLQALLPHTVCLAACLAAYWQQPEQQTAQQVLLAQAAATRSCAYLRCSNVGAEGGPAAGQGLGSMRCRCRHEGSMRSQYEVKVQQLLLWFVAQSV